jgi:hypothetical protein
MADLEPRVRQVEEDVAILKGEIKSVLMEVRTSLLSQTNPFTSAPLAPLAPPAIVATPVAPPPSIFPQTSEPAHQPSPWESMQHSDPSQPMRQAEPPKSWLQEGPTLDDKPLQNENRNDNLAHLPQPGSQLAPQRPVPVPVAPRRNWELNTLAMLLAWCQGNMVRLSEKEMTSLLSLARYGGLVDEELAGILLEISNSFDDGKTGRAATVSEYLLALHELHTVIREEEDPAIPRLRRAG